MIVKAEEKDISAVAALAAALWPHHLARELEAEFAPLLGKKEAAVFLKLEGSTPGGSILPSPGICRGAAEGL